MDAAYKANVVGCIALGSREGWFAGHRAGLGKLFLWIKPEQQQRLCRQHMLGKKIPIYQQSLCGTPGDGKQSWCGNKQWSRVSCSTKGSEEKPPTLLQKSMKESREEQGHSPEDQQLQGPASHGAAEPSLGGMSPSLQEARKGLCLHPGDVSWTRQQQQSQHSTADTTIDFSDKCVMAFLTLWGGARADPGHTEVLG